jgi:iron(III) transport system ATP-binding protein
MEPRFVIDLSQVTKRFRSRVTAVNRLSLDVLSGEVVALLGPSGSGKSTVLRLIAGFERPDDGAISIAGRLVASRTVHVPPERRGVGMVFQDYALFPHLTVAQNVAFGLRCDPSARAARVTELLGLVGLSGLEARYPHELSGGQQQRVALARALAPNPTVLLMDEPFSNLDADLREQMRREVRAILRATQATTLFVTHDQREAFALADRVAVLHAGVLEQCDRPEVVYHQPATRFVADFVGQADFLPATVQQGRLKNELGDFGDASWPEGARLEVLIRPDHVKLSHDGGPNAVVLERQFLGDDNVFTLELDSGAIVHSVQPTAVAYQVGARLRAWATPVTLVAFPLVEQHAVLPSSDL